MRSFRQRDGFFTIEYPDNWRAYAPARGYGVVIAPEGGIRVSGTQSEGEAWRWICAAAHPPRASRSGSRC